jgi:polyphosphate kinase 2
MLYALEQDPEYIHLQTELVRMQKWVMEKKKRMVIIFEGRDAAGKGGAIMRFVRFLNPRGYRIVALMKPTKLEKGQWFFQRYAKELPNPGEIVLFDRSWYNRAVVEPVMGFCTKKKYDQFMEQVVPFEKMLMDDGIILVKFWFSIDNHEQQRRLDLRRNEPLQQWKLSIVDQMALDKWDDYTHYKKVMFDNTATPQSPWVIIKGNNKDLARLEAMRYVISKNDYPEKGQTGERIDPDESIVLVHDNDTRIVNYEEEP